MDWKIVRVVYASAVENREKQRKGRLIKISIERSRIEITHYNVYYAYNC